MNANTEVWVAGPSEPRAIRIESAVNNHSEWFITKREAWLAIAKREAAEASHKELGASEARARQAKAEKAAAECAP